jgi:hypothetical protein
MHITYTSPCKDAGNPDLSLYTSQVDMDRQARVVDGLVDIGADELYSCDGDYTEDDFSNAQDWNVDGLVNLNEFNVFQQAWLSHDPDGPGGDPNGWNPLCNLDDTGTSQYVIDLADANAFLDDWLWKACWKNIYDCIDSVNVLDTDADGLVNMTEFSQFAKMWQTNNPTDPDWQFWNLDNTGDIDLNDLTLFLDDWLWVACWRADEFPPAEPPAPILPAAEPTNLERAINLHEASCILEDMSQNDPNIQQEIDPNDWQAMVDSVCDELDTLLATLTENELMAYDLFTDDCGCTEQMAASGGGESMMMSEPMETMAAIEPEPVLDEAEWEENPYTQMPLGELSSLATGIYSVLEAIDVTLVEGHENTDNLMDAKDFLENVLLDIEASRKN